MASQRKFISCPGLKHRKWTSLGNRIIRTTRPQSGILQLDWIRDSIGEHQKKYKYHQQSASSKWPFDSRNGGHLSPQKAMSPNEVTLKNLELFYHQNSINFFPSSWRHIFVVFFNKTQLGFLFQLRLWKSSTRLFSQGQVHGDLGEMVWPPSYA